MERIKLLGPQASYQYLNQMYQVDGITDPVELFVVKPDSVCAVRNTHALRVTVVGKIGEPENINPVLFTAIVKPLHYNVLLYLVVMVLRRFPLSPNKRKPFNQAGFSGKLGLLMNHMIHVANEVGAYSKLVSDFCKAKCQHDNIKRANPTMRLSAAPRKTVEIAFINMLLGIVERINEKPCYSNGRLSKEFRQ